MTIALYPWREYAGTVAISRRERRQNSGRHRLINLLEAKIKQAELSLKNTITTDLFADIDASPASALDGFFLHINDSPSTTTVGSVSGATYSWWRNYQADVTTFAANLESNMRTAFNSCSAGGGDFPDGILCSQTALERYEALADTQNGALKRFINEQMSEDLGFTVFKFKGADMFWDAGMASNVPASGETMLFLNSKYIRLVIDRQTDFITTSMIEPTNQTAFVGKVLFMGNLVNSNRRMLGILHGIDA